MQTTAYPGIPKSGSKLNRFNEFSKFMRRRQPLPTQPISATSVTVAKFPSPVSPCRPPAASASASERSGCIHCSRCTAQACLYPSKSVPLAPATPMSQSDRFLSVSAPVSGGGCRKNQGFFIRSVVMKSCLLVIDVQESFRHRPYFSEAALPAYLAAQNALIAF